MLRLVEMALEHLAVSGKLSNASETCESPAVAAEAAKLSIKRSLSGMVSSAPVPVTDPMTASIRNILSIDGLSFPYVAAAQ